MFGAQTAVDSWRSEKPRRRAGRIPPRHPLLEARRNCGPLLTLCGIKAIGAAPDAVRMQRVVSFYEKLPRGAPLKAAPKGFLARYQAKHFGETPTVQRTCDLRPMFGSGVCGVC